MTHWWETVGPNGLPRFYIFLSRSSFANKNYQHINVVELKPTATELPRNYRSKNTKRSLLRTRPLYMGDKFSRGARVFARAERVVEQLNSMTLSVMAVDREPPVRGQPSGLQQLFDQLWAEDVDLHPDQTRR